MATPTQVDGALVEAAAPTTPTTPTTTPKSPTSAKTPTPTNSRSQAKRGNARSEEPVDPAILEVLSRKGRAGRRPGAVWDFFTPLKTAQNRTHATCNFCARRCAGVAARMISHILDKCPSAPTEATEALVMALAHGPAHKRQRVDASQPQTLSTALTLTNDSGVANAAAMAVGLAAFRAHVANGNTRNGGGLLTLEEVDPAKRKDGPARPLPSDTLTLALHKLVVACLRRHAPLELLEDEFFRDALVLLRPGSSFALKQATGEALVENVHATVVHDIAQWMRASETFTLIHRDDAAQTKWRGADDKRHAVLLVERTPDESDMATAAEFVQSLLPLVGDETVVGVCSDSPPVLEELATNGDVAGRVKLWSKCLLTQSAELWSLIVQLVPQVTSVAVGAAEIARLNASNPVPSKPLTTAASSTNSSWCLPFSLIKRVLAMSQSLKLSETQPGDSEGMASAARSEFWKDLAAVDALLAPFPWLFVLGESEHATSSHFVLLWIWLLTEIETSTLLTGEQRECLLSTVTSLLRSSLQDHHLVALLLDPRLCGVGLSATGRRKAKALVMQVAARLWPSVYESASADDDHGSKLSRQSLLTQLSHYLDKSAYFADDVAWEMVRGSPPETFWKDYAKDAPELFKLAMAVLTFVPVSSHLTSERRIGESEEPFIVRQTRFHFERNRKNGENDVTNLLTKHCELLAPFVFVDATSASSSSANFLTEAKTPLTNTATRSGADAVSVELERVRSITGDKQTSDIVTNEHGVAFELAWFAYETDADGVDIKAALRHLVPPVLLARPPKPPSDFTAVLLV